MSLAVDLPVGSIIAAPRRHRVLMKVRTDGWNRIGDTDLDPDVIAQAELDEDAVVLRHGYDQAAMTTNKVTP